VLLDDAELDAVADGHALVRDGLLGDVSAQAAVCASIAHVTALRLATVGRSRRLDPSIRTDAIGWIDDDVDPRFSPLLALFEVLRGELNERAYLGLTQTEVQLGHYGVGGTYARHRDAFAGGPGRVITAIWYANPGWQVAHGGCLRVWDPDQRAVEPLLDRLIVFRSDTVSHEVELCHSERFAITAWYRPRGP
jgi:SM-20-related protein